MEKFNKQKNIEYIKHAIELEKSIITQEKIIEQYNEISIANKPSLKYEPKPVPERSVDMPETNTTSNPLIWVLPYTCVFCGLMFSIVGTFMEAGDPNPGFIAFGLILLAIGIIIIAIWKNNEKKEYIQYTQAKEEASKQYDLACKRVEEKNETIKQAYDRNISEWERSNTSAIAYLNKPLRETRLALSEYYQADIIYPKYRNLPALTSILEYLSSGRCDELTGSNGAYNIYENEVRQNIVISQLNTIIDNLEQIRQNQYILYNEITSMNQTLTRVVNELSSIRGYTFALTQLSYLNTFYSGVAAMNSSALALSTLGVMRS